MTAPVAAAAAGTAGRTAAAAGTRAAGTGKAAQAADTGLGFAAGRSGGGKRPGGRRKAHSGPQRLLVAEFLVCIVILALSPMGRPTGETEPRDWMKRGTAMCGLFALLGLVSAVGPKSGRAAAALGGLVTVVLMVDQRELFSVIAKRLNAKSTSDNDIDGAGAAVGGVVADAATLPGVGESGMGSRFRGSARAQR
jgi:hypothetical protein